MRSVAAAADRLFGRSPAKSGIRTQVLAVISAHTGAARNDGIQDGLKLRDIMMIGRGHDDRQRDATRVHQQHSLAPLFFPDPSGLARRILGPVEL